jgi:parvulin-like peptidyl-prolyl isomerase
MIIIKYEDENEVQTIIDAQTALGFHLIAVSNVKEGNFLGFDDRNEPIPLIQPTNQELSNNQFIIMSALADIYVALPTA